jgi:mono/diheme cytochrome c family protein
MAKSHPALHSLRKFDLEGIPMLRASRFSLPLALLVAAACSDSSGPNTPAIPVPDVAMGRLAFEQSCSGCHASHDGFDIRTFGFTDTTIIRRAVKHVDSATARNIVAYIHSLNAPPQEKMLRLFQPKGAAVNTDLDFAIALFGRDAFPEDMTTASLAAIDPRNVQIAVKLPVWADEESNMDWMPDFALPPGILNYNGALAAGAIAGYTAAPTKENLTRALNAIKTADRATANENAPCLLEDTLRVRFRECFDVRRWASTLVALYMMHNGMNQNLGGDIHDIWWDVGNAARQSTRFSKTVPIDNPEKNWTAWMYLGWSFDPSKHSSFYLGNGFKTLGLNREAAFVAVRSEIARPANSMSVYEDVLNAERFSPNSWTAATTAFALRHLNERLNAGERPPDATQKATALSQINTALTEAAKKVSATDKAKLDVLAAPVLAVLKQ